MTRYFFDTYDDEKFICDDVGTMCADMKAVKEEAALSLAELAREVLPTCNARLLAVKVRDDHDPVLEAHLRYEAKVLRNEPNI